MGKFSGVLITSDIDGTLYGKDLKLHKQNAAAIKYFTDEGGKFTLASGRALYDVCLVGKDICNTYCIACNGGVIGDKNGMIYTAAFEPEMYGEFKKISEIFPYADLKLYSTSGIFAFNANKYTDIHQQYIVEKIKKVKSFEQLPRDAFMFAIWTDREKLSDIRKYFEDTGLADRCNSYIGFTYSYEGTPKGVDKGSAALKLKEIVGAHTLVTAGDNENDAAMLKAGDISFTPKNATDCIKPLATINLDLTADDCIMPAIIEYLEKTL